MGIEIIFTNFVRRGKWFYDIFAFFHVGRKCRNGIRPRNKIWNENFCHFQLLPGGSTPNHDNFNLFKPQHFCAFQHRMSSRNVFSSFPYYSDLSGRKLKLQKVQKIIINLYLISLTLEKIIFEIHVIFHKDKLLFVFRIIRTEERSEGRVGKRVRKSV